MTGLKSSLLADNLWPPVSATFLITFPHSSEMKTSTDRNSARLICWLYILKINKFSIPSVSYFKSFITFKCYLPVNLLSFLIDFLVASTFLYFFNYIIHHYLLGLIIFNFKLVEKKEIICVAKVKLLDHVLCLLEFFMQNILSYQLKLYFWNIFLRIVLFISTLTNQLLIQIFDIYQLVYLSNHLSHFKILFIKFVKNIFLKLAVFIQILLDEILYSFDCGARVLRNMFFNICWTDMWRFCFKLNWFKLSKVLDWL